MFCVKCGEELKEGWKVCPVCGYKLEPRAEQEKNVDTQGEADIKEQVGSISSKEPPTPKKNKKMLTIIIAAVLLVVIGGGVGTTVVYPKVKQYQKVKADQAVADKVIEGISSIKSEDISVDSEKDLDSIKTQYNKLTSAQKEMVSNYDILDEAYKTLGIKKDEQVAQKLVDSINKIQVDKLSDSDTSIQELKKEFEALPENQKKLVVNSSKLDEYGKIIQKKKEEKAAKEAEEKKAAEEAARQEEERQAVINEAVNTVVGKRFHLIDSQLVVEFTSAGEFVAIGYYGSSPLTNKYCTYSFSAEYALHKDEWQYLVNVTIEGATYFFRTFTDGKISLDGNGEFSGWYELL